MKRLRILFVLASWFAFCGVGCIPGVQLSVISVNIDVNTTATGSLFAKRPKKLAPLPTKCPEKPWYAL